MSKLKVKVIKVTKYGFASIYVFPNGERYSEPEFIKYLCEPHDLPYEIHVCDIDDTTNQLYITSEDKFYYPYLCSNIANYEFTPDEFYTLYSSGRAV